MNQGYFEMKDLKNEYYKMLLKDFFNNKKAFQILSLVIVGFGFFYYLGVKDNGKPYAIYGEAEAISMLSGASEGEHLLTVSINKTHNIKVKVSNIQGFAQGRKVKLSATKSKYLSEVQYQFEQYEEIN